jgi:salicylate hydroxylase
VQHNGLLLLSCKNITVDSLVEHTSNMAERERLRIAIVGAGIAGLTAAIALKNHPAIDVQIYEQASKLREIGASIALGPNGLRTLERLGVHNALDDAIAFRNKSGFPMIYR